MSEVKLVIRDANEDRSGTVHGAVAEWFIAALSADPVSIAELDAAVDRFALESPAQGHFPHFVHRLDAKPWDAGLVVIDLQHRACVQQRAVLRVVAVGKIGMHAVRVVGGNEHRVRHGAGIGLVRTRHPLQH